MRIPSGAGTFMDARFPASGSQLINCHAYPRPPMMEGEENPYYVKGAAGLDLVSDTGAGTGCDGLFAFDDKLYGVFGTALYGDLAGTPTLLGTIAGSGLCTFSVGRTTTVIQRDGLIYSTSGATLTSFTLPGGTEMVSSVAELDSFTLYTVTDSDKMYSSKALDPDNIDGLDFATAESRADDSVRLLTARQTMWVFGKKSVELYYNAGSVGFPFQRYSNAMIETGLLAKHSAAQFQDTVFFIGTDSNVYLGKDINAKPASQGWLEELLGVSDVSAAYTVAYVANGVVFFAVTIPDVGTFELNSKTGAWSNRTSHIDGVDLGYWRARGFAHLDGRSYVGDSETGKVFRINADSPKEDGEVMEITHGLPGIPSRERRDTMSAFDVDFNPGVGDGGTLRIDYTDDDGRTFKGLRSVEAVAGRRTVARRLGQFRRRHMRIRYSGESQYRVDNVWISGVRGF